MAAILCTTIGELLSKCCEGMKLPCQYLGQACGKSCEILGGVMCTPFAPYLIITLALNTPSLVYGIYAIQGYGCSAPLVRWLIVNAAFVLCHMMAAFYITNIIRAPATQGAPTITATTGLGSTEASVEEGTYQSNFRPLAEATEIPGGANSMQRIKHVLCYDKGVAIYIMIFFVWIVWMGVGVIDRLSGEGGNCDELKGHMVTTIVCGYLWMGLVGMVFCCSLLCLR